MSTVGEERYVDLKKLCDKVEPKLYDTLSWILILNLDLIPEEDILSHPSLNFSYNLMLGKTDEALTIAKSLAESSNKVAQYYQKLLEIDPKLEKTQEISNLFFALAHRRIELAKKLGVRQY